MTRFLSFRWCGADPYQYDLRMDVHKKTLNIDHARLQRVRRVLRASTDTGAIHMAMDWVLDSQAIIDDLMAVAGKGAGKFRETRRRSRRR